MIIYQKFTLFDAGVVVSCIGMFFSGHLFVLGLLMILINNVMEGRHE